VKFDNWEFHEILSRNSESGYNQTTISGTSQEDLPFILLTTMSSFAAQQGRIANIFLSFH